MAALRREIAAVLTLLFVAPLIAEYLLGDLPLKLLPALVVLAPVYGGGAVLIREAARQTGRGWPTMLMLGAAYAVIAEGLVTQSLFNHDYLQKHLHLLDPAYLPAFGIGAWWTLLMLNLHAFWSMGVSIALVEALFPPLAEIPWLGRVGSSVIAALFVLGSLADFAVGWEQNRFLASKAQLVGAAVLGLLLIVFAFSLPARVARTRMGMVPEPWLAGACACLLGLAVLLVPQAWGWAAVAAVLAIDSVFLCLLALLSRRKGWCASHVLSLAAGGALAYGAHAFLQRPLIGGLVAMRISNTVFLGTALGLVYVGMKRVSRRQRSPHIE